MMPGIVISKTSTVEINIQAVSAPLIGAPCVAVAACAQTGCASALASGKAATVAHRANRLVNTAVSRTPYTS
jgi:hypothetical protein